MQLGIITQHIVSTKKNEQLTGCKLLVVRVIEDMHLTDKYLVAVDSVGAGEGEIVLVAHGSAARIGIGKETAPVDSAIIGIVDEPASVLRESAS